MSDVVRFLVIDGYAKKGRDQFKENGATIAGDLYTQMLRRTLPGAECDLIFPSDADATLPEGVGLAQYDGIAWTGCSLTIFDDDPRVKRQIELARQAYAQGIPSFGSCWALQIAIVAAGGLVQLHPWGREMGIAHKITLTPAGRGHPLYAGKPSVFDGFISHDDEVTHLPTGAVLLASNSHSHVQAACITHQKGTFWGLQYHPEYNLHEMARLAFCRIPKLIGYGFFRNEEEALVHIDRLEALHQDPSRKDLAWQMGIDTDVMDEGVRTTEVRNWIDQLVLPEKRKRGLA